MEQIQKSIASLGTDIREIKSDMDTLNTNTSSIKSAVDALKAAGSGMVKSIQRGVAASTGSTSIAVNINTVNVNKTIVLLDGNLAMSSGAASGLPYLAALVPNQITIGTKVGGTTASPCYVSWQVIEFN